MRDLSEQRSRIVHGAAIKVIVTLSTTIWTLQSLKEDYTLFHEDAC